MLRSLLISELFSLLAWAVLCSAQALTPDEIVAQRRQLAYRQRRIILNDDGNVVIYYPKELPLTIENVLAQRTSPLVGSQVDSIFYCPISAGFGYFTHNTKAGYLLAHPIFGSRNIAQDLIALGTDALKMIIDFGHAHQLEVFFSMRMNDTHDAAHRPDNPYPLFPPLKAEHPEWLLGSFTERPPYGQWSGVDYGRPEIRDLAFRFIEEVCRNYNIDGVELDFFRHLHYFKSVAWGGVASPEECEMMTELLRRVRRMADEVGRQRGRPILLAVRVPDSAEYSRAVGLDWERWLAEGLVDLLIGSGYFQLNPWNYIVAKGHQYGVPVYASLDESRVRSDKPPYLRNSLEAYRARAAAAWQAGVDGIYLFNFFNPRSPMLREIGDPRILAHLDKTYFVSVRNYSPEMYLKGGETYRRLPLLTPDNPIGLTSAQPLRLPIYVGQEALRESEAKPQITLALLCCGSQRLHVRLNGSALPLRLTRAAWREYAVAPEIVQAGENHVEIVSDTGADQNGPEGWDVVWTASEKPPAPWTSDRPNARVTAELEASGLRIADRGTESGDYLYYYYAWNASPEREAVAEIEAKVISGRNNIIVSNGVAIERVGLLPDHIELYSTPARYAMNTTDDFHTYRIVIHRDNLRVFVDGKPALDGTGKFTAPSPGGRNAIQFGAATSTEVGEALWRAVRFRTGAISLFDLVLKFDYP